LLYDVGQAARAGSLPGSSYTLALTLLNETIDVIGSRVLVRDDGTLREAAAAGALPELPEEAPCLRRVAEEGRVLGVWFQPDSGVWTVREIDPMDRRPAPDEGPRASRVYLPLRAEPRVEGVLVVGERNDGRPFSAEDWWLLMALADQLAAVAERTNLADQRARARALEESDRVKSALISSISHELKTPLAAIKASATTLLEPDAVAGPTVRRELAEAINRETDRLTRLVSNMLDMSRIEAGVLRPELEWVSIADVVSDVLDRMAPLLAGRPVTVDLPAALPPTPLDFVLMSQVLTNLLDNAVRYSPPDAAIEVSAAVGDGQLRLSVFNERSHIPPDELDRLFEKFHRLSTAPGGTGLGLTIARGMVEAHGGRIWAENVGPDGLVFRLTVPSPAPPRAVWEEPDAGQRPNAGHAEVA
jgi:two-component system sensor histidine kinase KdpD